MQHRVIELEGKKVEYSLRKRRGQRTYTLSVHANGRIIVTVPKMTSVHSVERFLNQKSKWLQKSIQKIPKEIRRTRAEQKVHYKEHKELARTFVTDRLYEINKKYAFSYGRISIRSNTTRWGSCSELGNLNFDYRILFLPPELQEYLLVHELCHLKEMNHSRKFWALVEQGVPNYKVLRKELRSHTLGF